MPLTCMETEALLEDYKKGVLPKREMRYIAAHFEVCAQCRELYEQSLTEQHEHTEKQPRMLRRRCWNWFKAACVGLTILALLPPVIAIIDRGYILPPRMHGRKTTIENNLKQWWMVFQLYTHDSPGEIYPPLTDCDDLWVPDLHALYPDNFWDLGLIIDPDVSWRVNNKILGELIKQDPPDLQKATRWMAQTFVYAGWASYDASDVELMKRFRTEKGKREGHIRMNGTRLYWMPNYIGRYFITDVNNPGGDAVPPSRIPVMIARPRLDKPRGGNFSKWWFCFKTSFLGNAPALRVPTVFMDGHIEFVPLDSAPSNIKAMLALFPEPLPE